MQLISMGAEAMDDNDASVNPYDMPSWTEDRDGNMVLSHGNGDNSDISDPFMRMMMDGKI